MRLCVSQHKGKHVPLACVSCDTAVAAGKRFRNLSLLVWDPDLVFDVLFGCSFFSRAQSLLIWFKEGKEKKGLKYVRRQKSKEGYQGRDQRLDLSSQLHDHDEERSKKKQQQQQPAPTDRLLLLLFLILFWYLIKSQRREEMEIRIVIAIVVPHVCSQKSPLSAKNSFSSSFHPQSLSLALSPI